MYLPEHFAETDMAAVARLLVDFPLAAIVAQTSQGLVANHIPLMADGDTALIGHIALANDLHRIVPQNTPVLAIFRGQDAYISPNLYPSKADHHRHVPTWNYQVVHVAGQIAFQHDVKTKRAVVGRLTRDHEAAVNGAAAWRMSDAPRDYMDGMLDAIVALRITITAITAKAKISQNRTAADHAAVQRDIEARGLHHMAARMKRDRSE